MDPMIRWLLNFFRRKRKTQDTRDYILGRGRIYFAEESGKLIDLGECKSFTLTMESENKPVIGNIEFPITDKEPK